MAQERAAFFVDGSNWYHGCAGLGLRNLGWLDFARVCEKLAGRREWICTRYYVGRVPNRGNTQLATDQVRFLGRIRALDACISVHLGRLESRSVRNEAAAEFRRYLGNLPVRIDATVYRDLVRIANVHPRSTVMVEKAVDVQIAVDMVVMAERDWFDGMFS